MVLLQKDKIVNQNNVKSNFLIVEEPNLRLRKKVSVFSLHGAKSFKSAHEQRRITQTTLPEPGIYLKSTNELMVLLEEDDEDDVLKALIDKYNFYYLNFKKDLKYTLFKPIYKNSQSKHLKMVDDKNLLDIITQFNGVLSNCIKNIKYANIQPKLIAGGSSGTYIIYGSNDTSDQKQKPCFIFKPMNEEPYSKKFQPKWLKYLQYNLLPFTFGRECLLDDGNYGYITDLLVCRLDYLLFKEKRITPWCDVCVLESGSFFNNYKQIMTSSEGTERTSVLTQIQQEIIERYSGGLGILRYYVIFVQTCIFKLWYYLIFFITGGYKPIAIQRKLGSLQVFENGFVTAKEFLRENPLPFDNIATDESFGIWNKFLLNNLHEKLQRLYILDFITRNTDRNLDNWMLRLTNLNKLEIKAIDNSLAFPYKHPSSVRMYPFEWIVQLPRFLLEKPLQADFLNEIMEKLTDMEWWQDWRVVFWECHSRSGKVFVSDDKKTVNNSNYFDNPLMATVEEPVSKLNIDYKVNLQWSLFKGQAFLLYKLIKAGLSGIEINILDLIQMERCYVYEDPCYYYYQSSVKKAPFPDSDNAETGKLKKAIWEGLGLDINVAFNEFDGLNSDFEQNSKNNNEEKLDTQWKLYLNGKISDQEWLKYLRHYKNYDNGADDYKNHQADSYNPFQENLIYNEEESIAENESNDNFNAAGSNLRSKYTIASSINNDTSLISEYFYDALSSISNEENRPFEIQSNNVNQYESLPIQIPSLDERNKEFIINTNNSVISKTPVTVATTWSSHSRYSDIQASMISENVSGHHLPSSNLSKISSQTKYEVEVVYIDRLAICEDKKPFFRAW